MTESIVRFESRTVIQAPVSEVFERLADLPGYGRWMHRTGLFRGCRLTSQPPVRRGTTYLDSTRMGTFDGEVTEFVPPTRIAFRENLRWFGAPMTQAADYPWWETSPRRSFTTWPSGAVWLDEVHEACRSMAGEPGTKPHPELPETFPGIQPDADAHHPAQRSWQVTTSGADTWRGFGGC